MKAFWIQREQAGSCLSLISQAPSLLPFWNKVKCLIKPQALMLPPSWRPKTQAYGFVSFLDAHNKAVILKVHSCVCDTTADTVGLHSLEHGAQWVFATGSICQSALTMDHSLSPFTPGFKIETQTLWEIFHVFLLS